MTLHSVSWFALGTWFGLLLCGWLWHPRFESYRPRRYQPRRRRSVPPSPPPQGSWMDEAFPLPPPDAMEAINRQLDRDIAAEVARRARIRGGSGPLLPVLPPPPQPRSRRRTSGR
jgi:hypothetical protein